MTLDTHPGDPAGGPTVVVKTQRAAGGFGLRAGPSSERAGALRFLHDLGAGVAPQLLAADDGAGVVVMTDMGAWPNRRGPRARARAAGTGRARRPCPHRRPMQPPRAEGRRLLRAPRRAGPRGPGARAAARRTPERWEELCDAPARRSVSPRRARLRRRRTLVAALGQPAPLLVLTHQDLTPGNGVLADGGVRWWTSSEPASGTWAWTRPAAVPVPAVRPVGAGPGRRDRGHDRGLPGRAGARVAAGARRRRLRRGPGGRVRRVGGDQDVPPPAGQRRAPSGRATRSAAGRSCSTPSTPSSQAAERAGRFGLVAWYPRSSPARCAGGGPTSGDWPMPGFPAFASSRQGEGGRLLRPVRPSRARPGA